VLVTDALSQSSDQGFQEVSRIGVQLLTTDEVVRAVQ
jgi:hypothetical protein